MRQCWKGFGVLVGSQEQRVVVQCVAHLVNLVQTLADPDRWPTMLSHLTSIQAHAPKMYMMTSEHAPGLYWPRQKPHNSSTCITEACWRQTPVCCISLRACRAVIAATVCVLHHDHNVEDTVTYVCQNEVHSLSLPSHTSPCLAFCLQELAPLAVSLQSRL